MEFCEVASMSMELLGSEHFDVFYGNVPMPPGAGESCWKESFGFLPWMAVIDSFQHWLYTQSESDCRGKNQGMVAPDGPLPSRYGLERIRDGTSISLAAPVASLPRAVLLRRVWNRTTRQRCSYGSRRNRIRERRWEGIGLR